MSSKNILTASIVVPVTLGIAGLLYYATRKPKTNYEKHLEELNQKQKQKVVSSHGFVSFGGSTRRHKKGIIL
jgi:hypothetical protein